MENGWVLKRDKDGEMTKTSEDRKSPQASGHAKFRNQPPLLRSLVSQQGESCRRKCVFCWNVQYPASCDVVKDNAKWRNIWNEIIDVLFACDLVTMWRNAKIETHAVTAVSGIISRFVRCVTKKARNRRKFLPKKRRQQRQQCATKQRELFSYKRRRLQLLTMYFRNCVSQNSSGYRKSTYLHKKPMKIKAKSVTCQVGNVTSQHLWIWKVHKTTMRCSKPTLTRISGRNRDISAVFSEDLFSGVC